MMQITTDVATMKKALAVIKPSIAKRGTLPALTGARFEAKGGKVTVTGSDLDLTIQTDVSATVVEDGVAIVPFTQLTKLLKGKGSLELKTQDRNIAIQNGSLSTLQTLPAEEFLRIPDFPTGDGIPLDPELLVPAASLAAVVKNGAPAFLHVGPTHTATRKKTNGEPPWITDGQPSHYRRQHGTNQSTPNPEFKDWDESYQQASDSVSITSGATTWFSRLIEGQFPNYGPLFPDSYPHTVAFDRDETLNAVAGVKPMCREAAPVRLKFTHNSAVLTLHAITQDVGEATAEVALAAPWDDADFVVAFNPDFFSGAIAVSVADKVSLSFIDALKPSLMTEVVAGRTFDKLLMPVRVS